MQWSATTWICRRGDERFLATLWLGKKVRNKSENESAHTSFGPKKVEEREQFGYYMTRNFMIFAGHV